MAKLSAYGQREVLRAVKEYAITDETRLVSRERVTYALMHNGRILKKVVSWFRDASIGRHDYGWKVFGHLKATLGPADFRDKLVARGFTVELDAVGTAPTGGAS